MGKIVTFRCDWCGIVSEHIPEYYGSGKHQCSNCSTKSEQVETLMMDALIRLGSSVCISEILHDMYQSCISGE